MLTKYYLIAMMLIFAMAADAQTKVGINTTAPERQLHIYGSGSQYLRLRTTIGAGSLSGLELLRGNNFVNSRDWKIENYGSILRWMTASDNFNSPATEAMRFTDDGYLGIGTTIPITNLHIDDGTTASNTMDGYMMLGSKAGSNMVFDGDKIIARNNGVPGTLHIQTGGGNTTFGGGNVYAGGDGHVSQGGAPLNAKFNVEGAGYQIYLRNDADDVNDWYIGASSSTWLTGDDYLLFSPGSGYLESVLRLKDVNENTGSEAPVMIVSGSHAILMDGNEIDSYTPLYINHNSNENTYINPSGGDVGIGTTNPSARLHINTDEVALTLQDGFNSWWIQPVQNGNLNFFKNTSLLAAISYNLAGAWVALSDQRFKDNIQPLDQVMDKINRMGLRSYGFIHHEDAARDIGVIAQEVQQLFPEVVYEKNDLYGVSYDQLTVVAIKGIQEQQLQLEAMIKQIDDLLAKP